MENEKIFKTDTGFCQILPDKIVLTRDKISRVLKADGGLSLVLFYFALDNYIDGQRVLSILIGLVGIWAVYGVASSISNSATLIIDRQRIKEVKLKKQLLV